ncbi:ankyrin repeat domain-containing protein [Nocardioides pantholopis]|uniref:ankyrin repeat domain-containing protein n=1 Tax=Nocardioides pantholopis TaxID=2483798 RepID=UPI000F07F584|nr:ankyrin repeat domain-containing protein [Nocardioides pantholopis]
MSDGTNEPVPHLDQEVIEFAHKMFDLARAGDAEQLLAYVDAGLPVNLTDPQGNTLLMLAAYHGQAAVVAGLAERGADIERTNDRGQTPLAGAVFKGDQDVIDLLVRLGADLDAGHPTARETAAMFGRTIPGATGPVIPGSDAEGPDREGPAE